MKLGMIGLGRMGGNMTERLLNDGHKVVVFDPDTSAVETLGGKGASRSENSALQPGRDGQLQQHRNGRGYAGCFRGAKNVPRSPSHYLQPIAEDCSGSSGPTSYRQVHVG